MKLLRQINVKPPARLLEIGCGTGWMAEFMAITGFDVTGTSIVPADIKDARRRITSVAAKGLTTTKLRFEVAPMEAVDEMVGPRDYSYDAVYVFRGPYTMLRLTGGRPSSRVLIACGQVGGS